jgi:hypothetical protein
MLDKNMDWKTLRGKGDWLPFNTLAPKLMEMHLREGRDNYTWARHCQPQPDLFPIPGTLEGSLGYMDTQQLMRVQAYEDHTPQAQWVREVHDLDYCHVKMHVQPVGMVVKNHRDHNGTLTELYKGDFGTQEVIKVLHFLSDWQVGQVVMMGAEAITGWRAGDSITFPWYMEHATANCNDTHERQMLFIAGLRLQK